jgi:hypothetical protein
MPDQIHKNQMNMKRNLAFLLFFAFMACKKENTPTLSLDEKVDKTKSVETAKGNFSNGPYGTASGQAKIYTVGTATQLALENFSSSNGPDLKVYLSKEKDPVNFINLGDLKATSGNQLYDIPNNIKTTDYKYVLIHCKRFNHLFGFAEIN